MPQALPESERAAIREAIQQGKSCNAIAREFQRSSGTISAIAKKAGLSFERVEIKAAAEAHMADVRGRLARVAIQSLEDYEYVRAKLRMPHLAYSFGGKDNDYNEHLLPEPPAEAIQKYVVSMGVLIDKARQITADQQPGVAEARGLILDLLSGASRPEPTPTA